MPGVDLVYLAKSLDSDSIRQWIDDDIIEALNSLGLESQRSEIFQKIFVRSITDDPELHFGDLNFCRFILSALDKEKHNELERRFGKPLYEVFSEDFDIQQDAIRILAGFFGVEFNSEPAKTLQLKCKEVNAQFPLFEHQRRAAQHVWRHIYQGTSRVLLHMPTGAGKTRTAMHVIARFLIEHEPGIVVWLASSAELLEQAADSFEEAWTNLGNREVTSRRFWGGGESEIGEIEDGIIIGGLQKFNSYIEREPIESFRVGRRTKLVVVDEAHQAIAPTYKEVIEQLTEAGQYNALFGLSATPGRTWNDVSEDSRLAEFFGGRKVVLSIPGYSNPVSYLISNEYLARPEFRAISFEGGHLESNLQGANELEYSADLLENLGNDVARTSVAIKEIQKLISEGHKRIIFFAASVAQAKKVSILLNVLGIEAGVVTGDSSGSSRARTIRKYRRASGLPMVMCNYGVLTTGFDAPETSGAVIGRPTKSLVLYSQMVGRATRGIKAGGNLTCTVSTVVDTNLPGFSDIAEAFMNWEDVWGGK